MGKLFVLNTLSLQQWHRATLNMAGMDAELKSLLKSLEVPEPTIEHVSNEGCFTKALFADWIPEIGDIVEFVRGTDQEKVTSTLAKLRHAYRRCQASNARQRDCPTRTWKSLYPQRYSETS